MPMTSRRMRALRAACRREHGAAMIMVSLALVTLFTFAVLAVDMSMVMAAKGQLQSAADAAALAGASGLATGSTALATSRAVSFASYNTAVRNTRQPVVIAPGDVTFPTATRVRVVTHRTTATGDPVRTYFLRFLSLGRTNTTDVRAVAVAEVENVCATQCLKPWAVPDRWSDTNGNGKYDAGEPYNPTVTGYMAPYDVGFSIVLKIGNPQQAVAPGNFFPVDFPPLGPGVHPITGGSQYRTNIATCAPYTIGPGDSLQVETGNMVGPTRQGAQDLIALDPGARWDTTTNTVTNSAYGFSPRICIVPFWDPRTPPTSGRNNVHITKLGAFFIESVSANSQVTGRFMQISTPGQACPPGAAGSFIKTVVLVQ